MKFTSKYPQFDKIKDNQYLSQGWEKIKEPSNLLLSILVSLPFMAINSLLIYLFFRFVLNINIVNLFPKNGSFTLEINLLTIAIIIFFILLHEFLHLFFIPNVLNSKKIFFGLKIYGGFTYTEEIIKKNRYLLISIFPFLILSFIFPLFMNTIGYMNNIVIIMAFLNGLASSVDLLIFFLVLIQVHSRGSIVNNGNISYYKKLNS